LETNHPLPERPPDPDDVIVDIQARSRKILKFVLTTLTVLVLLLTGAVVYLVIGLSNETQHVIATLNKNSESRCTFYSALGSLPLPAQPFPAKRTVQIVAASRGTYVELGCQPTLPPAGNVLREAGRRYHVNVNPK
jgi:hypothetical protein